MKHFLAIFLFSTLLTDIVSSQEEHVLQKVRTIPGNYVSFSIDNMENIYLLSAFNQLKKLNANGDSIAVYNDLKKLGDISIVDVSNPLKILLYSKDFATITLLDGMLNQKSVTDLRKKSMFSVSAAGLAYDGKIWIFDETDNNLKKIDENGNTILQTADFRQLFDLAPSPERIFDYNQYVYLYDSISGIFVFDYYGTFKTKIPITLWQNIGITNQYFYGTKHDGYYKYDFKSAQYSHITVPRSVTQSRRFFYGNKYLYVLNDSGLNLFLLK
ncbi:MAG: hypothetical protein IPH58_00380 [Sphingobacteriales bacterium]|nr:hypothetical protein [Sphingobacteriales bacterium]